MNNPTKLDQETLNKLKSDQLSQLKTQLDVKEDDKSVDYYFDDAIQVVLDYTNRSEMVTGLFVYAKKLATIYFNQQSNEGETQRTEGSVTRSFEVGIPLAIRNSLSHYRLGHFARL